MPKLRMPLKTVSLDFSEDGYPGFQADARLNPPMGLIRRYVEVSAESEEREAREILLQLFPSWNFCDENGKPIPHSASGFDRIPMELLAAMQTRRAAALKERAMPGPLGSESSSGESPDTTASPT